jgi:hypothetical protein
MWAGVFVLAATPHLANPSVAVAADDPACAAGATGPTRIWWSPREPSAITPLRVLAVAEVENAELRVVSSGKKARSLEAVRRSGPPPSYAAIIDKPAAGTYEVSLVAKGKPLACARIAVAGKGQRPAAPSSHQKGQPAWVARLAWDAASEGLYAAWIEQLFDAPIEKSLDFRPLHQALRDPARNFLHNHLGLREDDPSNRSAVAAAPDCADLPYFLRAYFAWKMELPFGFRDCDRGTDSRPPRCPAFNTNMLAVDASSRLGAIKTFFRQLVNKVQSGSARTSLSDEESDYYPVKLDRRSLRPGVVYADPYGHVLMIVKWVPQTKERGGLLLAVDGQPDTSIGRKRFWEGTFLFTNETRSAGPGFKAFRPVVAGVANGKAPVALGNSSITEGMGQPPFSPEQSQLTPDAFYAWMAKLISPAGIDAVLAYDETLDALVEQIATRLGSVDNGEAFMREKNNPVVPMPEGAKIFETIGPWEDYATPSRDMRLLIAIKVLLGVPERVVAHPELFRLAGRSAAMVRAELQKRHQQRITERSIDYKRSDGSSWKLTVADILARRPALEMAYNPNDCVEERWGAQPGTPEHATCKRHAPADQRARMEEHRTWFREARRPPR